MSDHEPGDSHKGQGGDRELACLRCNTRMEFRGVGYLSTGSALHVVTGMAGTEAAGQKLDLWTCPKCGTAELSVHVRREGEPVATKTETAQERTQRNAGRVGKAYSQLGKIFRREKDN